MAKNKNNRERNNSNNANNAQNRDQNANADQARTTPSSK